MSRRDMSRTSQGDAQKAAATLLDARAVAVVGASPDDRKIGGKPMRFLRDFGFAGDVYPVNPRYEEIRGYRCYPDLESIDAPVDAVIVAVPSQRAQQVVAQCVRMNIGLIVMFSSGYAETGAEGAQRQAELMRLIEGSTTRLLGPNALGVANLSSGFIANFSQAFELQREVLRSGHIGFVSQSGAFGTFIFALSVEQGLGFKYFVATGNEADVTFSEVIDAMADDSEIRVIAGYIEGIRDGRRFTAACEKARVAGKQVVLIKTGSTPGGSVAAMSHTAAIAGADEVYEAVFRQARVLRVTDEEEMLDVLAVLESPRAMRGCRVGVLTMSGGAGVLIADALDAYGLELAPLALRTKNELASIVPEFGSTRNPVDLTGQFLAEPEMLKAALGCLLRDPGVDGVLVFLGLGRRFGEQIARTLHDAAATTDKPLLVAWIAGPGPVIARLREQGVPVLPSATRAVRSMSALARCYEAAIRPGRLLAPEHPGPGGSRIVARGTKGRCSEAQAKELLSRHGFQLLDERLARTGAEAAAHAAALGCPVALKVCAADLMHKSDAGGVALGIQGAEDVQRAYEGIIESVRKHSRGLAVDGVLVAPMAPAGVDMILGARRDPVFGPVLLVGAGGIYAEVLRDTALGVLPLSREDAEDLLRTLRAYPLLQGVRGEGPGDVAALLDAMDRLGDIMHEHPEIEELEINPLRVLPAGKGVIPLDALMIVNDEEAPVPVRMEP